MLKDSCPFAGAAACSPPPWFGYPFRLGRPLATAGDGAAVRSGGGSIIIVADTFPPEGLFTTSNPSTRQFMQMMWSRRCIGNTTAAAGLNPSRPGYYCSIARTRERE